MLLMFAVLQHVSNTATDLPTGASKCQSTQQEEKDGQIPGA